MADHALDMSLDHLPGLVSTRREARWAFSGMLEDLTSLQECVTASRADIGTGGSRAVLVNHAGEVMAAHTAAHEDILMRQPLWAEQRPENWWDAVSEAIRGVLSSAGVTGSAIRGIGLSGQMHGLVILDSIHRVIRPSLIWCDQRSEEQVAWVNRKLGTARALEYTQTLF